MGCGWQVPCLLLVQLSNVKGWAVFAVSHSVFTKKIQVQSSGHSRHAHGGLFSSRLTVTEANDTAFWGFVSLFI